MVQQEPVTVQQHLKQSIDNSARVNYSAYSSNRACDNSAGFKKTNEQFSEYGSAKGCDSSARFKTTYIQFS